MLIAYVNYKMYTNFFCRRSQSRILFFIRVRGGVLPYSSNFNANSSDWRRKSTFESFDISKPPKCDFTLYSTLEWKGGTNLINLNRDKK